MGPIRLDEWGPPMEEVVYILLARNKDKFSLVYVDECTKSDDVGFFTKNPRFKCWINHAGSENNLYVAIHPMFGSSVHDRRFTVGKIVSKYSPPCNMEPAPESVQESTKASPESKPEPKLSQNETLQKPLDFYDSDKGPIHYVKRYINEESYKSWFHRNYPNHTIFEGIGISKEEYQKIVDELNVKTNDDTTTIKCACCGSDMHLERELEKSNLYKCTSCGISDTRLK